MHNAIEKTKKVFYVIIAILLGIITGINVLQVIARYAFPNFVIYWSEDVTLMIVVWIMSIGMPALWIDHEHLTMDIFSIIFKKNKKLIRVFDYIINVIAVACGAGMTVVAVVAIQVNTGIKGGALMIDESIRYYPLLVFGIGLFFAAIICIVRMAKEDRTPKTEQLEGEVSE